MLIGGSPCQSVSITRSKDRTHLKGKSKLFFEFVRAKNECNPKWFLFENVASMNDNSKKIMSEYLGCEPIMIDSKYFSAQERQRLYWTNIPILVLPQINSLVLRDIMIDIKDVPDKYWYTNKTINNINMSRQICATIQLNIFDMHKRVFNPNFKCHTLTCVSGGNQQKKVMDNGRVRKLMPIEYERLQTLPDNYTEGISDGARYSVVGNGWTVDVICHLLLPLTQTKKTKHRN